MKKLRVGHKLSKPNWIRLSAEYRTFSKMKHWRKIWRRCANRMSRCRWLVLLMKKHGEVLFVSCSEAVRSSCSHNWLACSHHPLHSYINLLWQVGAESRVTMWTFGIFISAFVEFFTVLTINTALWSVLALSSSAFHYFFSFCSYVPYM